MTEFLLLISGLLLGGAIVFLYKYYKQAKSKQVSSSIILNNIKRVAQLITVQGEFVETYEHQEAQKKFFNLLHTEKKALLIVKGTAHIGLDLKELKIDVNEATKTLNIVHLPEAQVLSLNTDIRYYDLQHSVWNKFNNEDLSRIQKDATNHLMQKVLSSNLREQASLQATKSLSIISSLAENMGWNVTFPKTIDSSMKKHIL